MRTFTVKRESFRCMEPSLDQRLIRFNFSRGTRSEARFFLNVSSNFSGSYPKCFFMCEFFTIRICGKKFEVSFF